MRRNARIRVMLADKQEIVRMGLRRLLEESKRYSVISEAGDEDTALHQIQKRRPHVVILDTELAGSSGPALIQKLKAVSPETAFLVFSNRVSEPDVLQALQAGALGYISKNVSKEEIAFSLFRVLQGMLHLGPYLTASLIDHLKTEQKDYSPQQPLPLDKLTGREKEIAYNLALGLSNHQIAEKFFISPHTVHNHRNRIMRKLQVHSISELVLTAMKSGMVTLQDREN